MSVPLPTSTDKEKEKGLVLSALNTKWSEAMVGDVNEMPPNLSPSLTLTLIGA